MKRLSKTERAQLVHNARQGVSPPPEDVQRYEATVVAAEGARDISVAIQDKQTKTIDQQRTRISRLRADLDAVVLEGSP